MYFQASPFGRGGSGEATDGEGLLDGSQDALTVLDGDDLVEAHGLQDGVALADGLAEILGGVGIRADGDETAAAVLALRVAAAEALHYHITTLSVGIHRAFSETSYFI